MLWYGAASTSRQAARVDSRHPERPAYGCCVRSHVVGGYGDQPRHEAALAIVACLSPDARHMRFPAISDTVRRNAAITGVRCDPYRRSYNAPDLTFGRRPDPHRSRPVELYRRDLPDCRGRDWPQ